MADEDLLEAFLPFQLEDASSSAFILYLIRTINPALLTDEKWPEDVQYVIDKMISKGSVAAPLRKWELGQLEDALVALSPVGNEAPTPSASAHTEPQHQEHQTEMSPAHAVDSGWDTFLENGMIGISPTEMLDLAAQLEVDSNFVPQVMARTPPLGHVRTFSTAKMPKKEFLCLLPDKPNVSEQRKIAGPLHYEQITPQIASGTLVVGGGTYEQHPVEGKPARQTGSMIIYAAESADEVWEIIKSDVYAAHGVWDLDKVQVIPYVSAVRVPMPSGK
ncbi:Fungal specific transcription factor [Lasiodiplodia theobromae]|uniref:Fungal specific transcription factor n=1 Tax=Lasiodiplodia theobromae TaxID=45133 RepID=UPI0015C39C7F|nr:Fungal specific transcription factor [Lasiodiplodia theobromae]KAF4545774.1 Fungal specific transcription factor [Lasiodiplodia theobromae]